MTDPSYNGPPGAQRPVVRLDSHQQKVILARVDPRDPASSVLIRVRPQWDSDCQDSLLRYMNGSCDQHHRSGGRAKKRWVRWLIEACEAVALAALGACLRGIGWDTPCLCADEARLSGHRRKRSLCRNTAASSRETYSHFILLWHLPVVQHVRSFCLPLVLLADACSCTRFLLLSLCAHYPLTNTHTCDRWEVYICTTSSRAYAEAAWCLLDPAASLFPHAELSWRLLAVPPGQKKDLLNVLRQKVYAQDPPVALLTDAGGRDMGDVVKLGGNAGCTC